MKIEKVAIWTILAGALWLFVPFIADPYQTPRLLLPALGAIPLLLLKRDEGCLMDVSVGLALCLAGVSWIFSQDKLYSIFGAYLFPTDSLLAFVVYFAVLLAAARCGWNIEDMVRAIVKASIPVCLYAIFQRFFPDPLLYGGLDAVGGRVVSTQGGPVFLGSVLAITGVCSAWLARKGSRIGMIGLALSLTALYFARTRGGLLALAVGAAFIFPRRFWIPAGAIALVGMAPRLLSFQSDMARLEVWRIALRTFFEHPIVGYGPGNFTLAFRRYQDWRFVDVMNSAASVQAHAHNEVLHALATMGILGLLAYLLIFSSALRVAQESPEESRPLFYGLLAAYLVISMTNPVTTATFILLALLFGVSSTRLEASRRRFFPALASAIVVVLVGRLCVASRWFAEGARSSGKGDAYSAAVAFNRAAQLNPWEMVYTCKQVDSLVGMMGVAAPGNLPTMVRGAMAITERALRWHPMDSYAHEIRGKIEVVAYQNGFGGNPAASLGRFNRGQELAPTFEVLMWRRRAMALALRDESQLARVEADLDDLRKAVAKEGV